MDYIRFGQTGLQVSRLCLGTMSMGSSAWKKWVLDEAESVPILRRALDLGITFFDTSDTYGAAGASEEYLGRALAGERHRIVLATKFARPMAAGEGASRRYIISAVEASLKRLGTDYIDLYQQHIADPRTPIEETLRALDDLVRQGKVRYIGCSNLPAWQVVEAQWTSRHHGLTSFVCAQDEYSLVVRHIDRELIPALQAYDMGLLPFFPLASGLLTGKYKRNAPMPEGTRLANTQRLADRFLTEANWQIAEKLGDFAATRGKSLLELAFSWLACRPQVSSVIAGATKPEQIEANVKAADWVLTPAEMAEIDRITKAA